MPRASGLARSAHASARKTVDDRSAAEKLCYLTTVGRRTGEPRRIEIWFAAAPAPSTTIYLLAGARDRAGWVRNLVANPRVGVELAGRTFAGVSRVLEPGPEDALARRLVYEKYRNDDDLEEWRETALPVAIDLGSSAS
jgi:deazaflavin-dependent oxidoreductase (nitroreductase family)